MGRIEGKVLVVDDASANRELLARKLQRYGAEVVEARSGAECLTVLDREPVDLVLLDIMMPEMSGYEVLEELKSRGKLHVLPVIVISAVDGLESVIKCIELGADDYLVKPVNWTLLRARCGVLLERKHLQDREAVYLQQVEFEQERNRALMRAVFPPPVVAELEQDNNVRARLHENVGVLFADVVGFTAFCASETPGTIYGHLQDLVQRFEDVSERHGLEKIKTIGDSFMACAGLWDECENPVAACVACGNAMVRASTGLESGWQVRVGIHCGGVVAGVVGHKRYSYDLWGDTVNVAARVEQNGSPGLVNLSAQAWEAVRDQYPDAGASTHEVKGKGTFEIRTLSADR